MTFANTTTLRVTDRLFGVYEKMRDNRMMLSHGYVVPRDFNLEEQRDIAKLVKLGVATGTGGGRNRRYRLVFTAPDTVRRLIEAR